MGDEEGAEAAITALRGYVFFGKPLRVGFAKAQSDVIAKMRGVFEESERARREQKRVQEKKQRSVKQKRKLIDKFLKLRQENDAMMDIKARAGGGAMLDSSEANNTLFVEGITKQTPTAALNDLFSSFPGFKEVRHITEKMVAFIEFEGEYQAGVALRERQGAMVEGSQIRVSYAKR